MSGAVSEGYQGEDTPNKLGEVQSAMRAILLQHSSQQLFSLVSEGYRGEDTPNKLVEISGVC